MWTLLPEVARACQELLKCGCKSLSKKCKCRDAGLSCTGLCYCGGTCDSAEMLGFHAQVFATVVEHATVNLFMCSYINILFLGRVDFSN